MTRGLAFDCRPIRDYFCVRSPKLILIAEKPLQNDKGMIFNSSEGLQYLSTCFKSKFLPMDIVITYVDCNNPGFFCKNVLFEICEYYAFQSCLDLNNLHIAFIGENAYNRFLQDYNASLPFLTSREIYLNNDYKSIKFVDLRIDKNTTYFLKYTVLPDTNNISNEITEKLNNIKLDKSVETSNYCSWADMVKYLQKTCEYLDDKSLKAVYYDMDFIGDTPKVSNILSINIADSLTGKLLYFSLLHSKKPDSEEELNNLFSEYKTCLKKILTTVPVYTNDTRWLDTLPYKNEIKLISKEEYIKNIDDGTSDRPSFKAYGSKYGNKSEWYDKWRKTTFNKLNIKKSEAIKEGYTDTEKYEWIYDIEVFKNDWLFVAKSIDGKSKVIIWNAPKELAVWVRNKILIGFNNAAYDDVVIRHIMAYPYIMDRTLTPKVYSDKLIIEEAKPEFPKFREDKFRSLIPNFLSWDLSFHMPFDIRRNSLKKLTMSVLNKRNYDSNVPFDIDRPLTEDERREVEKYCEMDVDNTRELFLPDPDNPKRDFARDSYDIRWNLIIEYNMRAKTLINKSSSFAGKVLCGEDAKPNLKNTYKEIDGKKVFYSIPDLALKELAGTQILEFYLKHQQNPDYIHEKFEYYMGGNDESHKYQFGFGGLHQALLNYGSTNLVNMDVASLYPSLLIQYNLMSRGAANPDSYREVYDTRIKAKHEGKTLLNLGLKLVLNGSIGAMLSNFNPLFDTWSNSSICVHGQLLLFILCKRLYDAGFNIVQTNTDGIMIERQETVDYMPICEQWMKETRLVLEFDEIAILQQNNVNNYYCQFTNGKVKSKGFYLSNEKFGKATSKILCNIVTEKPLLEGTEPRDYVIYKRHGLGEICDGVTKRKLEGRSLAFVVGYENDPRTASYVSISRNARMVAVKDEKGKAKLDAYGNPIMEETHTESKITGFTDHMLLVDDVNTLTMDEINTREYINFAKNLLDRKEDFGPYYDINFTKCDEPSYLQALNPLKDNTDPYPTKAGVVCQNFLFECDYLSKEEQEALIEPIKQYTYRIVWSGSRSYHIVVRVDKPVTSTSFKRLWYYFRNKLNLDGADTQCDQPNRYTRVPNQINPKTGNLQELYCENKYIFSVDDILEELPKIHAKTNEVKEYKGQINLKALERHIKRQDWTEGNRFTAVQKLSPVLISQVTMEELLKMIPTKLEKNHLYIIRAKYYYFEKYKDLLLDESNDDSNE